MIEYLDCLYSCLSKAVGTLVRSAMLSSKDATFCTTTLRDYIAFDCCQVDKTMLLIPVINFQIIGRRFAISCFHIVTEA